MQLSNNAAIRQVKVNGINYGINSECYMSNESGWSTSTYVPAHGEIVIYRELSAPFNTRFKVGDGSTVVGSLAFVEMGSSTDLTGYLKSDNMTITDLAGVEGSGVKFSFPNNTSNQLTVSNISSWNASSIALVGTMAVSANAPMVYISATGLNGSLNLNSGATATLKGGDVNIESTVTKTTISGPVVSLLTKAGSTTGPSINLNAITGGITLNGQVSVSGRMSNLDESAATPGTYVPQTYEYVTKKYADNAAIAAIKGDKITSDSTFNGSDFIYESAVDASIVDVNNIPIIAFRENNRYIVFYNGIPYSCVFKLNNNIDYTLGNAGIIGYKNTGEPFVITSNAERSLVQLLVKGRLNSDDKITIALYDDNRNNYLSSHLLTLNEPSGEITFSNAGNGNCSISLGTYTGFGYAGNHVNASANGVDISATNGISLGSPDGTIQFSDNQIKVGGTLVNTFASSNSNYMPATYEYVTKKYVDTAVANAGGGGGSGTCPAAQGYNDEDYLPGTMGIVTTDRPSSYSGLLIDNGYIRVKAADKSQIDSVISTYQTSGIHSKGIITDGPTFATPIAPINMGYAVTEVLRNMRYLGYSYDELKDVPGSICAQPMKMEWPDLKNESFTHVGTDYESAEITGELRANARVFPIASATSMTITGYDTWTPPSFAPGYSRDYELYFTTADQEHQDLSGHPFTFTLPEGTILLNEVEFEPETTYFVEVKCLAYGSKYFCRITPIKPWGATTVGGQTFSYDKNEQCVEMTPVQGGN